MASAQVQRCMGLNLGAYGHIIRYKPSPYSLAWASMEICADIEEFKEERLNRRHFTATLQIPVSLQDKPRHGHWNVTCSDVDGCV